MVRMKDLLVDASGRKRSDILSCGGRAAVERSEEEKPKQFQFNFHKWAQDIQNIYPRPSSLPFVRADEQRAEEATRLTDKDYCAAIPMIRKSCPAVEDSLKIWQVRTLRTR